MMFARRLAQSGCGDQKLSVVSPPNIATPLPHASSVRFGSPPKSLSITATRPGPDTLACA